MIYTKNPFFTSALALLLLLLGCDDAKNSPSNGNYKSSERYDIANPTIINLPVELDEISGIAYYPKDTSVFAVVDEIGYLYKIPIMNPKATQRWLFSKPKDFEDIILKDSAFYVMVSDGDIIKLEFNADSIGTSKFGFTESSSKKVNEFEGMYDDSTGFVLICKDCEADSGGKISRFKLNVADSNFSEYEALDVSSLDGKVEKLKDIKPAAAAINPVTGELYVISSVSKHLLVINKAGEITEVYELNPKIYKQPEGMAFTPAGDLIISNEVFLEGTGTLLILKNKLK